MANKQSTKTNNLTQTDATVKGIQPNSLLLKVVVFVLAFLIYAQTISYDYTLDDPISTTQNKFVQQGTEGIATLMTKAYMYGGANLNHGSYRPLPLVSFAIEKEMFGNNPNISHFINVLWYAFTCLLLYLFLIRLLKGFHVWLPFLATLLFVVHPIHTEVVASIKSRDEIMALFFLLVGGLLFFKYEHNKIVSSLLVFLLFTVAMLSKENALTFVVAFPMMLYYFRNYSIKSALLVSFPILVAAVVYVGIRASFLDRIAGDTQMLDPINNVLYAANGAGERYATALYIVMRYFLLNVLPHPLSWDYSYNQISVVGFGSGEALFSVVVLGALVYFGIRSIKTKNIYGFAIVYFFTTISIVSNLFVDVGATLGERFLFVPSLGFCIAMAYFILTKMNAKLSDKLSSNALMVTALLVVVFAVKTIARNTVWENNQTLFTSGIETAPNSARANFCLGYDYFARGIEMENPLEKMNAVREGIVHMQKAVEIFPKYVDAYKNIGLAYYEIKEYENALAYLKQALQFNQKMEDAWYYGGLSFGFLKNSDSAMVYLDRCLALNKEYPRINYFKGLILSDVADVASDTTDRRKKLEKSVEYFDKAAVEDKDDWEVYIQRGYAYGKLNKFNKAIPSLIKGTELNKNNDQALLFIGIGYGMKNMPDSAIVYLEKAKVVAPRNMEVYRNLAITYKTKGDLNKAIQVLNEGLVIAPGDPGLTMVLNELTKTQGN